ncbi:ATP-binding protein [Psychrobium sp. 1_MG-2023]|uniref:ATP-binding protein n=1 Tax=Psychrobium sp. 1_MG-2023 TaxID=3062624 RepID=UPI000C340457|nr:ATP-binding protein [Psychrobium sp. 1_MG-2023]MDP2562554.1 ATP-binding protein [Psychrobium sp. 1_MG-2023]PKF54426.1 two-component sensor histidine kinase [Alteromonadales bacterium alter-6D02]
MRRLYFTIIVTVLGALFATGWGLDLLVDHNSEQEAQYTSEVVVYQKLINGLSEQLNPLEDSQLEEAVIRLAQHFSSQLSLESADNVALPSSLALQLSQDGGLLIASDQGAYLLKAITNHPHKLLQLSLPSAEDDNHQFDLLLTLSLYLGVCLIIVLWSLPLTRRLFLLTSASKKFGQGELSVRIPDSRFSYIQQLEHSFNDMADQIEKLMADNKILARSLSHDIRTPLACLRFGVEAALDCSNSEKKDQYISRMESEITRMEEMTAAFLEYAGMERQVGSLKLKSLDLNEWLQVAIEDVVNLSLQQQVTVELNGTQTPTFAQIDPQWFYRALQNLLANAIDYADSTVSVTLQCDKQQLNILVEDDGPGIANSDLERVFDPFVRLDAERSREMGHFGLGLAITVKIMDWHQGCVSARSSSQLGGACLCLTLPLR